MPKAEPLTIHLKKGELVCAAGEEIHDLFFIQSGELLVFVSEGTKITPLAHLKPDEYLGELSFFDHRPRSAHVICMRDSTLVRIPVGELHKQFPKWLVTIAKNITKKLRTAGELIRHQGIRKKNVETMKPLTIEEQRNHFEALQNYQKEFPAGRHLDGQT